MEKNETTNKPKEPKVEIVSIEIIPDEDEIREIAKTEKKIERQGVIFFFSAVICIVCILCLIFIKLHAFFFWSAVISAIIAINSYFNAYINLIFLEPGHNDGSCDAGCCPD